MEKKERKWRKNEDDMKKKAIKRQRMNMAQENVFVMF